MKRMNKRTKLNRSLSLKKIYDLKLTCTALSSGVMKMVSQNESTELYT